VFSLIWASVVRFTALAPAVETHGRYSVAGWLFTTAGDLHLSRSIAGLSAPMLARAPMKAIAWGGRSGLTSYNRI
jgi:hypothetical protein